MEPGAGLDWARLTVLGSGILLPDRERHSAAHLLEAAAVRVLLDCGTGTVHGLDRHGVDWRGITHVSITHYHNDHVGDLSGLMFALKHGVGSRRTEALTLIGPPGFARWLEGLAGALGDHVLDPGFEVAVVELSGTSSYEVGDLRLTAAKTPHTDESHAYRLEGPWGAAGYTGDTGPSAAVAAFFAGVDVLVSECSLTDPPGMDLHLSPLGVAEMARTADPGLLVLTHAYPPLGPDEAARRVADAGFTRVVGGRDGLVVELRRGHAPTLAPPGTSV